MHNIFRYFFKSGYSELYGSAKWMSVFEKSKILSKKNSGLVVGSGRLSLPQSYANMVVLWPTGSGKSTRLVIKNLLALGDWKKKASAIVTDPSWELFNKSSWYLSRTHKIYLLTPNDIDYSCQFNPLAFYWSCPELHQLASIIAEHNSDTKWGDKFWTAGATEIIYITLSALKNCDFKYQNLYNLRWVLSHIEPNNDKSVHVNRFMCEHLNDTQYQNFVSFISKDSKVVLWFLSSALTALDLWYEPDNDVSRLTASNDFDVASLRKTPSIIYLTFPEHEIHRLSLLIKLFYSTAFKVFIENTIDLTTLPVFLILDEFGNMGRIPNFSVLVNVMRKRKISTTTIIQSLKQLETNYGESDASSILEWMNNKLFLPWIHDLRTLTQIEWLLWNRTGLDLQDWWGVTRKLSQPLLRSFEARMIPDDQAILISKNKRPVYFKLKPYYKNRRLNQLSKIPPYLPNTANPPIRVEPIRITDYW